MQRVEIQTAQPYSVLIAEGILPAIGTHIKSVLPACKIAVISDSNVAPLYGEIVRKSLASSGFQCEFFVFPAGELSKCSSVLFEILSFLAKHSFTRCDAILSLGGGVCGDIAGFAASIYLRGINFVQAPTSLLAAVDSSIGGKTAINLPEGKNLVGAFHQPIIVVCDTSTFKSLPKAEIANGLSEAIKCGVICAEPLFQELANPCLPLDFVSITCSCAKIKGSLVSLDVQDLGLRQLLNFGHTAAHAIEICRNFAIPHGHAVAIGMVIAANYSAKICKCTPACPNAIISALQKNNLPVSCGIAPSALCTAAMLDKKRRGDKINLILPNSIGNCDIFELNTTQLPQFFSLGMEGFSHE